MHVLSHLWIKLNSFLPLFSCQGYVPKIKKKSVLFKASDKTKELTKTDLLVSEGLGQSELKAQHYLVLLSYSLFALHSYTCNIKKANIRLCVELN